MKRHIQPEIVSNTIRCHALRMVHRVNASHIGSCLSIADILAVLYTRVLSYKADEPQWYNRDRFILSKGHGAAILYAVLAESGFFPKERLNSYCIDGSPLIGHACHYVPGVEFSTGSLGHGLPVACGMALAGKHESLPYRCFVLLSDGEMNEGSNWESILFASHHKLDNLVAIVDYNKIQGFGRVSDVLNQESLFDKWQVFNWSVIEIDGHNHNEIQNALLSVPFEINKPSAIIAHTVKGRGVSFMENKLEWHYKSPNESQLAQALAELGCEK